MNPGENPGPKMSDSPGSRGRDSPGLSSLDGCINFIQHEKLTHICKVSENSDRKQFSNAYRTGSFILIVPSFHKLSESQM